MINHEQEYITWLKQTVYQKISDNLIEHLDKDKIIKYEQLTNLKLLDLIFWSKANLQKKKVVK
jgi:hypothetical protein